MDKMNGQEDVMMLIATNYGIFKITQKTKESYTWSHVT
jgi:hypothetical protein